MQVAVEGGTTGSGTVQVAGTVDGAADSETLTFTANGVDATEKLFTAVDTDGITTTGLADETTVPTVSVKAVDEGGSPIVTTYAVAGPVQAREARSAHSW